MRLAIFITTYNERDNIEILLRRIFALKLNPGNQLAGVAVIDDSSQDGTQGILERLKSEYGGLLHVIVRKERGRGTAAITGFKYVLTLDCDCILEMDGDLSHNPDYINHFLSFVRHYDVVVGSRYVEGGYVSGWPLSRKVISSSVNFIYRLVLGTKIHDLSGAYRCYRRKVIESLEFDDFVADGYAIAVEVNFRCYKKGYTFVEIPIVFQNRTKGKSKFRLLEGLKALGVIFRLLLKYGRALRILEK